MPSAEVIETLRQRLVYDTPFWAAQCAVIRAENKQAIPLKPRPWQLAFDQALEKQRADGKPMRAIILKARKLGFSTWVEAKFMQRITQMEAQYAVVVGQDKPTAGVLFDMAKLIYDRLPTDPELAELIYGHGTTQAAPFSVKPQLIGIGEGRNGSRWMSLGDKKRPSDASIYETRTAGSRGGGRGYTPSLIHASEVAHWEDPGFRLGLMEAMPVAEETIAVFESTANGFNDFHTMWQNAIEGSEDPELGGYYVPLFFGWQDNPAYSRAFPTEAARERFERTIGDEAAGGDQEEIELAEGFGVSPEQLFWRRTKIAEMLDNIEDFHQEYPATPEQAFIGSGRPVFPGILVARAIREAEDAPKPVEGVLRGTEWKVQKTRAGTVNVPTRVMWVPGDLMDQVDYDRWGPSHRLKVWEHPLNAVTQAGLQESKRQPDGQYIAFADTARVPEGATDSDYHAIQVIDHITRRQVASYRSRIPLHDLPLIVYMIGLYYNGAWVAVEINSQGKGTVDVLQHDYRYPKMYKTRRAGTDTRTDAQGYKVGWETTLASKPLMEQTFGTALKEGTHGLRCVLTAREFSTYVHDLKRPEKHGAQPGAHDDLAISWMGAHHVAAQLAPRNPGKRKREDRWSTADDLTGY